MFLTLKVLNRMAASDTFFYLYLLKEIRREDSEEASSFIVSDKQ